MHGVSAWGQAVICCITFFSNTLPLLAKPASVLTRAAARLTLVGCPIASLSATQSRETEVCLRSNHANNAFSSR
ncbi:hypothetical protein [Haloferula sp.]|uniref:hypothetical protein n=1 Tax=Haloferula sp. TaxID=2497595 RepID=UPI00329C86EF